MISELNRDYLLDRRDIQVISIVVNVVLDLRYEVLLIENAHIDEIFLLIRNQGERAVEVLVQRHLFGHQLLDEVLRHTLIEKTCFIILTHESKQ